MKQSDSVAQALKPLGQAVGPMLGAAKNQDGANFCGFEKCDQGIAKITINRPETRNAFRPETVFELIDAFSRVREDPKVGVVLFTGEGPLAFCSGGDQGVRGGSHARPLGSSTRRGYTL